MDSLLEKSLLLLFLFKNISYVISMTQSAIKGSYVELRCTYITTDKAILWWKEGIYGLSEGTMIYSHIKPDEFRLRLSVTGNHSNGEYYLSISNVKETDEAEYSCSVAGNTTRKYFQLSVIEGPTSTTIASKTQDNKLKGAEDQDLTIRCTAVGGDPAPDMVLQIRNQNYTSKSSVRTIQHTVLNVDRTYDGAPVICLAGSQSLSYFPVTDTAIIYLILKPSSPTFSPDPVVTEDTKPLSVTCTSTGGRPEPTEKKWTIGLADVTSYSTVTSQTHNPATVISTLTYRFDRNDNGKVLLCGFRNDAAGSFITSTRKMDIKFSPSVLVENKTFNPSDVSRQINCVANGNPATYKYLKWQHKSKYGTVIRTLDGNHTLTLPVVSDETKYQDTGEYVCTVSNGIKDRDGNGNQQTSGFVFSKASPVFLYGDRQTRFGQIKKDVNINVEVFSQPMYNSLIWKKGSSIISSSTKYTMSEAPAIMSDIFHGTEVQVDGYKLILTIHNLEQPDFINYTLSLSNGVGEAVEHLVILMSASPPEKPTNLTQVCATESTVTLIWLAGFDGGQEQTFVVEYREAGYSVWTKATVPKHLQTSNDDLLTYVLSGLEDGTLYEIRMYAQNTFNNSEVTNIVKIYTKGIIQCKQETNIVTGVAVGLSIITVTSLIINGILTYRIMCGKCMSKKTESNTSSTDRKSLTEVYYSITDDKDKSSDIRVENYETLGTKDKPNAYDVFEKDSSCDRSGLNYETLGTKNIPNVYEELDNKTQDPENKLYSNTLI